MSTGVEDFIPKQTLGFYKHNSKAVAPYFATEGSACFDLFCNFEPTSIIRAFQSSSDQSIELKPEFGHLEIHRGLRVMIPTGIIFDIPKGFSVRLHPRSGLALKNGIVLVNQEAVIDSDYVEETFVLIQNLTDVPFKLPNHTRICQGELVQNVPTTIVETKTRPSQSTRAGGFGSTGTA